MIIVTDTSSDIYESEAQEMGVELLTLDLAFNDEHIGRNTPENTVRFYELLTTTDTFPTTSQPSPEDVIEVFTKAKNTQQECIYITLSSTISGTYDTACMIAQSMDYPHIAVLDSKQAITAQRMVVECAVRLRDEGKTLDEMVPYLENFRDRVHVMGFIDTLSYLKKGGRIPAPLAALGNMLKIKPTMAIENGELVSPHKTRSIAQAKKRIWEDMSQYTFDPDWPIYALYSDEPNRARAFAEETKAQFGINDIPLFQSMGVVAAHLGPGCAGFSFVAAEQ